MDNVSPFFMKEHPKEKYIAWLYHICLSTDQICVYINIYYTVRLRSNHFSQFRRLHAACTPIASPNAQRAITYFIFVNIRDTRVICSLLILIYINLICRQNAGPHTFPTQPKFVSSHLFLTSIRSTQFCLLLLLELHYFLSLFSIRQGARGANARTRMILILFIHIIIIMIFYYLYHI